MVDAGSDSDATDGTDDTSRVRPVGINHVALEVGDIDDALEFYGGLFEVELRSRSETSAFVDIGDQFIALAEHPNDTTDDHRHFGLVVDDADALEDRLEARDIDRLEVSGLEFYDPWGNRVQIVDYEQIQFTKADQILEAMGLDDLEKTDDAIEELAAKGMAPVGR